MTTMESTQILVAKTTSSASSSASPASSGNTLDLGKLQDEATDSPIRDNIISHNDAALKAQSICKICGKDIGEPEMKKDIPSSVAWLSFSCLFICCLWWISWIPFILDNKRCNVCKTSVKVCPHCYRRIDRLPV